MKLQAQHKLTPQQERLAYRWWRFRCAIAAAADDVQHRSKFVGQNIRAGYASTRAVAELLCAYGIVYAWALMKEQIGHFGCGPYGSHVWRWGVCTALDSHYRAPWIDIPF